MTYVFMYVCVSHTSHALNKLNNFLIPLSLHILPPIIFLSDFIRCVLDVKDQFSLEMSNMVLCFHTPSLSKTALPEGSSAGTVLSW